jgi:hypothetical protein
VNNYISLALHLEEGSGETSIFVNNRLFRQCRYLMLNIPSSNISDFNDVESIDEAAERLDSSMEYRIFLDEPIISPEIEFIAHCSNLQAWVEYDYDTRLLHRNLAFPLLKELTDLGDPKAKKVFKEEITKRYISGNHSVVEYLEKGGYLDYLSKEELEALRYKK